MTGTASRQSHILQERIAKKRHTLKRLDHMIAASDDHRQRREALQRLRQETQESIEADRDTLRRLQED